MKMKEFGERWMGRVARSPARLVRTQRWSDKRRAWVKEWVQADEPVVGWVVGTRTISSGRTENHGFDADFVWTAHTHHRVALVCQHPRQRPIPVPIDALEETDEAPDGARVVVWTDRDREHHREDMGRVKRDERGRWLAMTEA